MAEKQHIEHENGPKMVELASEYAVIELPRDAVWVDMTIKVIQNGELMEVSGQMGVDDIRKAFQEAEKNYISDDAVFTLTEKGRAMAEAMENGQISLFDE